MSGRGGKGSGIFSLGGGGRQDVGIGADTAARAMPTDLIFGRVLTDADIGTGVRIPEPVFPTSDAFAPYSAAWKEFDRLQRAAKGSGTISWVHWLITIFPGILSILDPHTHDRFYERLVFLSAAATFLFHAGRARWAKSQLRHWPCPRCHGEWPGDLLEKASRCTTCGLDLHQLFA
jgi:hypothetical protein